MTDETTQPGAEATAPTRPLIHSKLIELRRRIGGLVAKKSTEEYGPKFPVKSSKELMFKLRDAVDELELLVYVVDQKVTPMAVDPVTDKRGEVKAGGTCAYVQDTVRVEAADGSYRDFKGCGSGLDRDDKAGGKASTYAWKDALLKGLSIPDKEMVDSDDEEGQGREAKPTGARRVPAATKPPTASKAAAAEAEAVKAIGAAADLVALKALVPLLERLPEAAQIRIDPVYTARKAELGG